MSQRKKCTKCGKDFLIIDQEEKFLKDHAWPLPEMCPEDRQARRMALRDPRKFYKDSCDKCKKDIIVIFKRKKGDVVYCHDHYLEWYQSSDHLVK